MLWVLDLLSTLVQLLDDKQNLIALSIEQWTSSDSTVHEPTAHSTESVFCRRRIWKLGSWLARAWAVAGAVWHTLAVDQRLWNTLQNSTSFEQTRKCIWLSKGNSGLLWKRIWLIFTLQRFEISLIFFPSLAVQFTFPPFSWFIGNMQVAVLHIH